MLNADQLVCKQSQALRLQNKVKDLVSDYNDLAPGSAGGDMSKHSFELEAMAQKAMGSELGIEFK